MIGWIKRQFGEDPLAGRGLFRYTDGHGKRRAADPLDVWGRLEPHGPEKLLEAVRGPGGAAAVADDELAEKGAKARAAAAARLADLACEAFAGVAPFDPATGAGLSVAERIRLVTEFVYHLRGLADAARPFTSSPPTTAASPPG